MSVLITGGTGFIGLHTSRVFLDNGFDVVSTQYRVRRELAEVERHRASRFHREVADVTSAYALDAIFERYDIEHVLHLATTAVGVPPPAEDFRANMDGMIVLLDAARRNRVKRVVIASSITAYWGLDGPFLESMPMPIASNGPTGAFKKAQEITGLHFADRCGLDVVFARISFVYGPLLSLVSPTRRAASRTPSCAAFLTRNRSRWPAITTTISTSATAPTRSSPCKPRPG